MSFNGIYSIILHHTRHSFDIFHFMDIKLSQYSCKVDGVTFFSPTRKLRLRMMGIGPGHTWNKIWSHFWLLDCPASRVLSVCETDDRLAFNLTHMYKEAPGKALKTPPWLKVQAWISKGQNSIALWMKTLRTDYFGDIGTPEPLYPMTRNQRKLIQIGSSQSSHRLFSEDWKTSHRDIKLFLKFTPVTIFIWGTGGISR